MLVVYLLMTRLESFMTRAKPSSQTPRQMLEEYMFNKLQDESATNRLDEPTTSLLQYRNLIKKFMSGDENISDEEMSKLPAGILVRQKLYYSQFC